MKSMYAADAARVTADRRYLHACAEVGFDLPHTRAYVWKGLTDMGVTPRKCGRCGIVAQLGEGENCVLLRADMDALPIREASGLPFACTNGSMHACGHDMHTAMLLEAARILKAREPQLKGVVRLMFQPAEEILQGAADMMADGLLDAPTPSAAFMIHVLTGLEIPAGTVVVSAQGTGAPAAGMFQIRVQGKGCHGAMPHTGVDPIAAAAHIVLNLQQIQSREMSIAQPCALTIGLLHAGDAPNAIPDQAVLQGSYRVFEDEASRFVEGRIVQIAEQTAGICRAEARVDMLGGCPTLQNDERLSALAAASLKELLGAERVLLSSELGGTAAKASGSEDFANITHAIPSLMVALAAGAPVDGFVYPAHHPKVRFDEAALPVGAAVYACLAESALAGFLDSPGGT